MQKLMKAVAATMLLVSVVLTMGCSNEEKWVDQSTGYWVDLGLPSGLLWADHNVGATSPWELGDYFAWGETTSKSSYDWNNYVYGTSNNKLTKYCNNSSYGYNGFTDNLTTLELTDDAASVKWGNGARMPTKKEFDELLNYTKSEWTTMNGVSGRRFTSWNGNSIFLPAAGYYSGSSRDYVGGRGYYWSGSLYTDRPCYAWYLRFSSDDGYMNGSGRDYGFSVRPVCSSSQK